ncbi:MAG: type II toxin-antitoxin system VapC family toxin [Patescibacteria group bacterium]
MMGLLIDTSIILDFLRQKDKSKTIYIKLEQSQTNLYISIISPTELYSGKSIWEKNTAREDLELVLSGLQILKLDEIISKNAGELRAQYGLGIGDAIIAQTAIFHKLKLATLNVKDFEKIKGIKLYKL